MKKILFYFTFSLLALFSCTRDENPPKLSYEFDDVEAKAGIVTCVITCRNESVDDEVVHARVLLSRDDGFEDLTTYPLHVSGDSLCGTIDGLERNTLYYYCFEIYTNKENLRVDSTRNFTTLTGITVITSDVVNISQTTATGGGSVSVEGDCSITKRGICWSTGHNPDTLGSHAANGAGIGSFSVNMTDLLPELTYFVRAYATYSNGIAYGNEVAFTTSQNVTTPTVTTSQVTNITQATATGGGNVTNTGGATVTARGICWSTSHNPTISGNHTTNGTGTGSFTSDMTGLTSNTTYYVRAYAINNMGTNYGNEVSFTTPAASSCPIGAINALFSVSATKQVYFSRGNLQYNASLNIWRFADKQYEIIGSSNSNISQTYDGWIDLFGWGTSGWNSGANCYQPWSASKIYDDYYVGGSCTNNLTGSWAKADWGVYNAISNGGNSLNTWRTLTKAEWNYLFNTRVTSSGIRFAKAMVNGRSGVLLLPDDWEENTYSFGSYNSGSAPYSYNTITDTQWNTLEEAGAVFLPATCIRNGTSVSSGSDGYYWSVSVYDNSSPVYCVYFYSSQLNPSKFTNRYFGLSVRLVQDK